MGYLSIFATHNGNFNVKLTAPIALPIAIGRLENQTPPIAIGDEGLNEEIEIGASQKTNRSYSSPDSYREVRASDSSDSYRS